MLASSYEFGVDNQSGGILTDVTVTVTPWKFGATGALEYGTPIVRSQASIGDATQALIGSPIDNSSDLFLGAHGVVEFTGGGATTATFYMRITGATEWTMALVSSTTPDGKDYGFEI